MRTRLIALTVAGALAAGLASGAGMAFAAGKVSGSVKSAVQKAVASLVGGDIDASQTQDREVLFNQLDKTLGKKDKKGTAIRSPEFWVETITSEYFSGKSRKSAAHKKVVTEDMQVVYADASSGTVPVVFHGALAYTSKKPHPLLMCVVASDQDAKAYLETNWLVHEAIKKNWIVAAVNESDKFPIAKQPWLAAHAFTHLRERFNVHPNQFYMEAEGATCETIQDIAANAMPDRIAGLVLRKPTKAITSGNSKLYTAVVLHEGDADATAKAYTDLNADGNKAIAVGDTAMADVAAWLMAHPGRTLPTEYAFTTTTNEDGITSPWTGTMLIVSPQKRGDDITMNVKYDRDAGVVDITATNLGEFTLYMNDDLMDLDNPVSIQVNGEIVATRKFERSIRDMFETADTFGEYGRVFMADYRGFAPAPTPEEEAGDAEGGSEKDSAGGDEAGGDGAGGDGEGGEE